MVIPADVPTNISCAASPPKPCAGKMQPSPIIAEFPYLTENEFKWSCINLEEAFRQSSIQQNEWESVNLVDRGAHPYLRIVRRLPGAVGGDAASPRSGSQGDFESLEVEDVDEVRRILRWI